MRLDLNVIRVFLETILGPSAFVWDILAGLAQVIRQ